MTDKFLNFKDAVEGFQFFINRQQEIIGNGFKDIATAAERKYRPSSPIEHAVPDMLKAEGALEIYKGADKLTEGLCERGTSWEDCATIVREWLRGQLNYLIKEQINQGGSTSKFCNFCSDMKAVGTREAIRAVAGRIGYAELQEICK